MKEYRILRELEPNQPAAAGEAARDRLERRINELARDGWVVRSFEASHVPAVGGFGIRPINLAYHVLLERDVGEAARR